jgi:probable addiction module antidote protein
MAHYVNHEECLHKRLKNPKRAAEYLNAALEDVNPNDKDAKKVFLLALRDVVCAQNGMSYLAEKSGLNRESLYKTLSSRGNPRLDTFIALLKVLGLEFNIVPSQKHYEARKAKVAGRAELREIMYQPEARC